MKQEKPTKQKETTMETIETEEYKGITINIHSDQTPENPFEAWDCEPPLLTYYDTSPKAYQNAPETWREILAILPAETWQRGKRVEFIKTHLQCTMREFAELRLGWGDDAYAEMLDSNLEAKPYGWSGAIAWFEAAEAILNWGGITAVYKQSKGHCQGDVTLCLAIATPDWLKLTGVAPENAKEQLKSGIKLYGDWAWGNVYGYTLEDENGEDVGHGCWSFYGYDHEKSGLMESAREEIDHHLEAQAKEAATLEAAFSF